MDDREVIHLIKNGDIEAYSILVEKYHKQLLNFIFRIVRNESIVEDIGQEIFFSIYKSLNTFDENRGTPFSAWLFMSARNRCINELRAKYGKSKVSLEDIEDLHSTEKTPEQALADKEQRQALHASLDQLEEPYKSTILKSLWGESIHQIAQRDGVTIGTVKSRLFRAREQMKLIVQRYLGGRNHEEI
jgi:RNA polymerase sigma-70 factor (ECF subfamily)